MSLNTSLVSTCRAAFGICLGSLCASSVAEVRIRPVVYTEQPAPGTESNTAFSSVYAVGLSTNGSVAFAANLGTLGSFLFPVSGLLGVSCFIIYLIPVSKDKI